MPRGKFCLFYFVRQEISFPFGICWSLRCPGLNDLRPFLPLRTELVPWIGRFGVKTIRRAGLDWAGVERVMTSVNRDLLHHKTHGLTWALVCRESEDKKTKSIIREEMVWFGP